MASYDLNRRLEKLETKAGCHNELEAAIREVHRDVMLAMFVKVRVLIAQRVDRLSSSVTALDRETRALAAMELRKEDALYRSMSRAEYLAGLPKSYICPKCQSVVPFDLERVRLPESKLPPCICAG